MTNQQLQTLAEQIMSKATVMRVYEPVDPELEVTNDEIDTLVKLDLKFEKIKDRMRNRVLLINDKPVYLDRVLARLESKLHHLKYAFVKHEISAEELICKEKDLLKTYSWII